MSGQSNQTATQLANATNNTRALTRILRLVTSTFGTINWLTGCHWSSPSHQNIESGETIALFTM
jgi:hypothetical protein